MEEGKRLFKRFRLCFSVGWIGILILGFIATGNFFDEEVQLRIAVAAVILLVVSGLIFYYYLGKLAASLNKSVIVWVGLTFMTHPIGTIVAYFKTKTLAIQKGWT